MSLIRAAIIGLAALLASSFLEAKTSIASPDGRIVFALSTNAQDRTVYSVTFDGKEVISESRLGLRFREQKGFDAGFELKEAARQSVDETWEQPWGERRFVRDHHNELLAQFADAEGRKLNLRIRVFDDGLGFRYEVPEQIGRAHV